MTGTLHSALDAGSYYRKLGEIPIVRHPSDFVSSELSPMAWATFDITSHARLCSRIVHCSENFGESDGLPECGMFGFFLVVRTLDDNFGIFSAKSPTTTTTRKHFCSHPVCDDTGSPLLTTTQEFSEF